VIPARHLLDAALQHYRKGEWQQAEELYLQILAVDPYQVDALHLLAAITGQTGREEQAAQYLRIVLKLRPGWAEAHNNLGNVYAAQKKLPEAVACFQEAISLKPDFAAAHNNLGNALQEQSKPDEAVASLKKALRLDPDNANAYLTLGSAYKDQGRLNESREAYRAALRVRPDAADIHSVLLFLSNFDPHCDAKAIKEECLQWNRRHAEPLMKLIRPHDNLPDPERRLRIGYVSPDLCNHVNSFFTIPLLSNHDHQECEIFCYADVARPDGVTRQLGGYADVWHTTIGLSDEQLAGLIRDDRIDILVDLAMHTAKNRLLVFARKPAPVQVSWLAYPGTTGLSAIDYRLTDPYLDPPGFFDDCYSEESLRLPETFWCYDPLADQPQVNALPATTNGHITFGCLNNFCKINDDCLRLWAQILHAVSNSRLILHAPCGQACETVVTRLLQEGISVSRLEFAERLPRSEYLKLYHRIDVALDPLPCNGGTTSLDALWMGVPTLTLLGRTVVGRAGWSLLSNLGLKELAAQTPDQFVELAARLAENLPRLQELRGTLRQRMQQSPLMDGKRFAWHMEQAYRQVWRQWCLARQRHEPA
jgi:predicted O-linked N-acetylglucosamine transferase (SPINDLY family)